MVGHPNRGRPTAASNPTPQAILEARQAAGLTQTQAATLIHASLRGWQEWEAGTRRMHPAMFELFRIKTGQAKP